MKIKNLIELLYWKASYLGYLDVVNVLIAAGADLNLRDDQNKSALDWGNFISVSCEYSIS